jgi:hypothetical protein
MEQTLVSFVNASARICDMILSFLSYSGIGIRLHGDIGLTLPPSMLIIKIASRLFLEETLGCSHPRVP